jgi:hypothetical protein
VVSTHRVGSGRHLQQAVCYFVDLGKGSHKATRHQIRNCTNKISTLFTFSIDYVGDVLNFQSIDQNRKKLGTFVQIIKK